MHHVDFVSFHNVTCYDDFIYHASMLKLYMKLFDIMCALVVRKVMLWSLECTCVILGGFVMSLEIAIKMSNREITIYFKF